MSIRIPRLRRLRYRTLDRIRGRFFRTLEKESDRLINDTNFADPSPSGVTFDTETDTVSTSPDVTGRGTDGTIFGPDLFTTSGTLPASLEPGRQYYTVGIDANTLKVFASLDDAAADRRIEFEDAGTGDHNIHPDASTAGLIDWLRRGLFLTDLRNISGKGDLRDLLNQRGG